MNEEPSALSAPFSSDARSHRCYRRRGGGAGAARPPAPRNSPPFPSATPLPPSPSRFGTGAAAAAAGTGGKSRRDRARLGQRELGGRGKSVFGKRGRPAPRRREKSPWEPGGQPVGRLREAAAGPGRICHSLPSASAVRSGRLLRQVTPLAPRGGTAPGRGSRERRLHPARESGAGGGGREPRDSRSSIGSRCPALPGHDRTGFPSSPLRSLPPPRQRIPPSLVLPLTPSPLSAVEISGQRPGHGASCFPALQQQPPG